MPLCGEKGQYTYIHMEVNNNNNNGLKMFEDKDSI
jgi:hypothetical protein